MKALEAMQRDPDIATAVVGLQSNIVNAWIQQATEDEVTRNFERLHWVQSFPSDRSEVRKLMLGKKELGRVRIFLTSGDKISVEASISEPERPEELARRDSGPTMAPGPRLIRVPSVIPSKVRN